MLLWTHVSACRRGRALSGQMPETPETHQRHAVNGWDELCAHVHFSHIHNEQSYVSITNTHNYYYDILLQHTRSSTISLLLLLFRFHRCTMWWCCRARSQRHAKKHSTLSFTPKRPDKARPPTFVRAHAGQPHFSFILLFKQQMESIARQVLILLFLSLSIVHIFQVMDPDAQSSIVPTRQNNSSSAKYFRSLLFGFHWRRCPRWVD